ncbi:MAG: hypothetical protein LUG93_19155 [Lachnospiraceae bacterium]|nr:hypothetical protein [Lachnospiraceae bacterium]
MNLAPRPAMLSRILYQSLLFSQKQEKLSSICIKGKNFSAPGLPGAEREIELEKLTTNTGLHLSCERRKREEENQRITRLSPKYLLFFKTNGKKWTRLYQICRKIKKICIVRKAETV